MTVLRVVRPSDARPTKVKGHILNQRGRKCVFVRQEEKVEVDGRVGRLSQLLTMSWTTVRKIVSRAACGICFSSADAFGRMDRGIDYRL